MNSTPYYLHAVMVHQGQASGGHYWAYTRRHPSLSLAMPTPIPAPSPSSFQSQGVGGDSVSVSEGRAPDLVKGGRDQGSGQSSEGSSSEGGVYRTRLETGEMYTDSMQQSPVESVVTGDESTTASVSCIGTGVPSTTPTPTPSESVGSGRGVGEGMEVESCERPCADEEGRGSCWLKFNDVSVSEVSWQEVRRESVGGAHGNTSAYCLVYINRALHQDWLQSGE